MIILPANTLSSGGYEVANSCRFNDGDSAYMHKTPGSAGNRRTFTISCWVKRSSLETGVKDIFGIGNSGSSTSEADWFSLSFNGSTNRLRLVQYNTLIFDSNRVFRDPSAWYHIVVAVDTTQGTNTNRVKLYINGVQETSFATVNYPSENYDFAVNNTAQHMIGREDGNGSGYFDGYLAEYCLIDGSALAPTSFGEFDEDSPTIWKPKKVSGLTFGTNGFYLDFEDSSNLGNDANGGTDFTEVNLAATDQATDTPTNNFATLNSNHLKDGVAYAEGNCKVTMSKLNNHRMAQGSTIAPAAGKWYCEVKCGGGHDPDAPTVQLGVLDPDKFDHDDHLGNTGHGYQYAANGSKAHNGTVTADHANTYDTDDIISIAMDLDNHKLYYAKNGTWQDSGDPTSGATGTGSFFDLATGVFYSFTLSAYDTGTDPFYEWNFGNPTFSISSGNADANGYGNFEYAVPSGYYALCTKNLAEYG